MEKRKQKVLDIINEMIELSEPIYYDGINTFYEVSDKDKLFNVEKDMPELGIANHFVRDNDGNLVINYDVVGISTLSIIATITDCLCGSRLSFVIEDDGLIIGVRWYEGH